MSAEKFPTQSDEVLEETSQTLDVMWKVHEIMDLVHLGHIEPTAIDRLHNFVEHSDVTPDLHAYNENEWLTLSDIDQTIFALTAILEDESKNTDQEEKEEIQAMKRLLDGRKIQIRSAIASYVSRLIQFHSILRHKDRYDSETLREKIESIDHERRRTHDALIDTLKNYNAVIKKIADSGYITLDEQDVWSVGTTYQSDKRHAALFSSEVLNNRDLVRRWAIAASISADLCLIDEALEKIKEPPQVNETA